MTKAQGFFAVARKSEQGLTGAVVAPCDRVKAAPSEFFALCEQVAKFGFFFVGEIGLFLDQADLAAQFVFLAGGDSPTSCDRFKGFACFEGCDKFFALGFWATAIADDAVAQLDMAFFGGALPWALFDGFPFGARGIALKQYRTRKHPCEFGVDAAELCEIF